MFFYHPQSQFPTPKYELNIQMHDSGVHSGNQSHSYAVSKRFGSEHSDGYECILWSFLTFPGEI
jgi:hypothetical protein